MRPLEELDNGTLAGRHGKTVFIRQMTRRDHRELHKDDDAVIAPVSRDDLQRRRRQRTVTLN